MCVLSCTSPVMHCDGPFPIGVHLFDCVGLQSCSSCSNGNYKVIAHDKHRVPLTACHRSHPQSHFPQQQGAIVTQLVRPRCDYKIFSWRQVSLQDKTGSLCLSAPPPFVWCTTLLHNNPKNAVCFPQIMFGRVPGQMHDSALLSSGTTGSGCACPPGASSAGCASEGHRAQESAQEPLPQVAVHMVDQRGPPGKCRDA